MLPDFAALMSAKEAPRYAFLIYIGTSTPIRWWTAFGDFETNADDVLDPSATYTGVGIVSALDSLRQLVGGIAERLSITLTADLQEVQDLIDNEASDIIGATINIGIVFFGNDWQTEDSVGWIWDGHVDTVGDKTSGLKTSIVLSVGSAATDRSRAGLRVWSNSGHQSRHTGDLVCANMSRYSRGSTVVLH